MASDTLEFVQGDANLVLTGTAIDATTKSAINLTGYDLTIFFWSKERRIDCDPSGNRDESLDRRV